MPDIPPVNTEPPSAPATWRRPDVLVASLALNVLALALPFTILQVYDRIIPNQASETFTVLLLALLGVLLLEFVLRTLRSYVLARSAARFDHLESIAAVDHVLRADAREFERRPAGYYLERINALDKIQEFYSGQAMLLVMDLPFVIVFIGMIYLIAGSLVAVPLVLLTLFAIVSVIAGNRLHAAVVKRTDMEEQRQNFLIEVLQGIHTIKSMAMEAPMMRRYQRLQSRSAESVYELARIGSLVQSLGASFSQLAIVSFVGFGAGSVIEGSLTIGALAAGTLLAGRVLQPGLRAMAVSAQFQSVRLARHRVDELYQLAAERSGSHPVADGFQGSLRLEHVSFAYDDDKPLLDDVSLTIEPGEAIAITGLNGAGKSTLIKLMAGYLRPNEGTILLDDRSVEDYELSSLRRQIAYLPQYGTLFEGSVLENMTLYREGDSVDQAIELARLLGLDQTLMRLPNGLDTQVNGAATDSLPEGVKKKIGMVRALLGEHKVLLFDDASANLDIRNDSRLLKLIKSLKGKLTIVIVSHRPSYVRACDRHFVLAEGHLSEVSDTVAPKVRVGSSAGKVA